jgi:two-component system NtrC family sensor kinase
MARAPRLGLRAQIVLSLALILLSSGWLLGFATLQITRRNAAVERVRAERLLERALAAQWSSATQQTDESLRKQCSSLRDQVGLIGLSLVRADGTRFTCGLQVEGLTTSLQLAGRARIQVHLSDPAEHMTHAIANLQLFYLACTGLTVALLFYLLLTYLIVRPLERLHWSAEQLSIGAEHVSVEERGSAEAVSLARTFNRMATLLRAERKQLTDRLVELERTTHQLQSAQRQLIHGEKLASVGRLAAGVAHEIGNPLAAILGLLELLRGGDLGAEQSSEFLARIAGETERINGIIRDLLDFARKEADADELMETSDLAAVIRDAVGLVRPQKLSKDVAIDLFVDPAARRVYGSARRLTQVALNLLLNALDALAGSGRVEIRVETNADDTLSLRVSDDGPGIAPEIAASLFEPFTTTKPAGKGTGLGLAVTHAIVDALQGSIEARNRTEGGACFEVRLRQVPVPAVRAAV